MAGRALVTGAAGSIGQVLVGELTHRGFQVDAWDISRPPDGDSVVGSQVDLRMPVDTELVHGYELVAHLASCTENRDDRSSLSDHLGSVAMTVHLLEALEKVPPAKVFLTSSQLVYRPGDSQPKEDSAVAAGTGFAAAKLASEAFLAAFSHRTGVPGVAFRLSNVIGPGTNRGVVADFVRKAVDAPPDGSVRVGGGTRHRRSFLSLRDCAQAMAWWAIETAPDGFQVVNVANRSSTSIADIADIVAEVTDVPFEVERDAENPSWHGDPGTVLPDVSRLTETGWLPAASSDQAVREAVTGLWERWSVR